MFRKIAIALLILIACYHISICQFLPRNNCFLGYRLTFTLNNTIGLDTAFITNQGDLQGCATDGSTGKLLFYTDYGGILDSTHSLMQDGDFYFAFGGLGGSHSIIFNKPMSDSLHYCFYSVAYNLNPVYNNLRFSIINRNLNNGLGAVMPQYKNLYIDSINNTNMKVAATLHSNGCYVWVASHECDGDKYYFYLVNDTGVVGPVTNQVGEPDQCNYGLGCFKFSPNGKLFIGLGNKIFLELFDFDNTTGILSNPRIINLGFDRDGVAFSPDNSKLYVSTSDGEIGQYDLMLPTFNDVINSRIVINPNSLLAQNSYKLQLGPDGKMYASPRFQFTMAVINYPDSLGLKCGFQDSLFVLAQKPGSTFSQFIDNCFNEIKPNIIADTIVCINDTVHLHVDSIEMASGYNWVINDIPVTTLNGNTASYIFNHAGNYNIKLNIIFNCMDSRSKTFQVHVNDGPTVNIAGDSSLCSGDTLILTAQGNAANYQWSDGTTNSSLFVTQPGNYLVTAFNSCGSKTVSKNIIASNESSQYKIINVFTPNSDNKNDFYIPIDNVTILKSFKIFDRWGKSTFESSGAANKWNGKINSSDAPGGIYYFTATIIDCNNIEKTINGFFHLIR